MDQADHYLQLALLGFDAFVASAAPAALVRARPGELQLPGADAEDSRDSSVDLENETMVGSEIGGKRRSRLEIYPLVKKAGASFPDMITVGRTPNNDIVLRDVTVSRLHAFFKHPAQKRWLVADGGSKNGTKLDGVALEPRREREVDNGQIVKIGDLEMTFYTAAHLFHVLGA